MCGSIPPMTQTNTMPLTKNSASGGGKEKTSPTDSDTKVGGENGGPTSGGGPVTKGGGAAEGASLVNSPQIQQTLASLVQALTALIELIKKMPSSAVNGANGGGSTPQQTQAPEKLGGGPTQKPTQQPTQMPVKDSSGGGMVKK